MRKTIVILASVVLSGLIGCDNHTIPACEMTPADLSGIAGWRGAAVNSPYTFRFVILSDRTGGHIPGLWAQAVKETNRLKPDFVITIGDLIEGYIEDEKEIRRQWKEFDAMTRKLDAPFFYCPGNHDVIPDACRKIYTELHGVNGKAWYSFHYRGCHFLVADSSAMIGKDKKLADEHWAWMKKDLAEANKVAEHIFVFIHHPTFSGPNWKRLRAMLDAKKTTVFSGHLHVLSYDLKDGIPYYVLSATAAGSGGAPKNPNRMLGQFQSYAHVVVDKGKPTISIIPLGEVLPNDFVDGTAIERLLNVSRAATLGTITSAGGEATLNLPCPADADATCTLTWTDKGGWFADNKPNAETLKIQAGKSAKRTYRIGPSRQGMPPPVLNIRYEITAEGRAMHCTRKLPLLVVASLTALPVKAITIDGKLDDWGGAPAHITNTRKRVKRNPEAWSGPKDCSYETRIGYDDKFLYLAVDVTDDVIVVTQGDYPWQQDCVAIFLDPRPAAKRVGRFTGPCRDIKVPVPPPSQKPTIHIYPEDAAMASSIRTACLRRKGGYTVEMAIPMSAVGERFKPPAGMKPPDAKVGTRYHKTLGMEVIIYDKDKTTPGAQSSRVILSGLGRVHSNIAEYAVVTFRP